MRMPISRVRSVTDTSMMFMMPMPPTSSDTPAMPPSSMVITRVVASAVSATSDRLRTVKSSSCPAAMLCRCAQERVDLALGLGVVAWSSPPRRRRSKRSWSPAASSSPSCTAPASCRPDPAPSGSVPWPAELPRRGTAGSARGSSARPDRARESTDRPRSAPITATRAADRTSASVKNWPARDAARRISG